MNEFGQRPVVAVEANDRHLFGALDMEFAGRSVCPSDVRSPEGFQEMNDERIITWSIGVIDVGQVSVTVLLQDMFEVVIPVIIDFREFKLPDQAHGFWLWITEAMKNMKMNSPD